MRSSDTIRSTSCERCGPWKACRGSLRGRHAVVVRRPSSPMALGPKTAHSALARSVVGPNGEQGSQRGGRPSRAAVIDSARERPPDRSI